MYNNYSESSRCFHIPQLAALPYDIYALVVYRCCVTKLRK